MFGQTHVHSINGKTFDKDCVAVIEAEDAHTGRELAHIYFGENMQERCKLFGLEY